MDKKLKSLICDIMDDYFETFNLIPKYQTDEPKIGETVEHVKEKLVFKYSYKKEIPDLEITIREILAEENFNS